MVTGSHNECLISILLLCWPCTKNQIQSPCQACGPAHFQPQVPVFAPSPAGQPCCAKIRHMLTPGPLHKPPAPAFLLSETQRAPPFSPPFLLDSALVSRRPSGVPAFISLCCPTMLCFLCCLADLTQYSTCLFTRWLPVCLMYSW